MSGGGDACPSGASGSRCDDAIRGLRLDENLVALYLAPEVTRRACRLDVRVDVLVSRRVARNFFAARESRYVAVHSFTQTTS